MLVFFFLAYTALLPMFKWYLLQFQFLELSLVYLVLDSQGQILLFIQILSRFLLSAYHVPDTILGIHLGSSL